MTKRSLAASFVVLLVVAVLAYRPAHARGPSRPPVAPLALGSAAEALELVGQIGGTSKAVAVQGSRAFFGVGPGLVVMDHPSPGAPVVVARLLLPGIVQSICISDTYAYIAADTAGLRVVDISDPVHPREVGSYDTPGNARDVAVLRNYACVADGTAGVRVIDVSNPAAPVETGWYVPVDSAGNPADARGAFAFDGYLYLATRAQTWDVGLRIVDILTTPGCPVELGRFWRSGATSVHVAPMGSARYAFLGGIGGVSMVDVTDPTQPVAIDYWGPPDKPCEVLGVFAVGDRVYAADRMSAGVWVLEIVDSGTLVQVGFHGTPDPRGIHVVGGTAYVASGTAGAQVLDASDPTAWRLLGSYAPAGQVTRVAISGSLAFLAAGYGGRDWGVDIVDVADPARPVRAGSYRVETPPFDPNDPTYHTEVRGVCVSGTYAYVAASRKGLLIVDVSDHAEPKYLGRYVEPWSIARDVSVSGNVAYLLGDWTLHTVDVSAASQPHVLGSCSLPGTPQRMSVSPGYAYVACGGSGLSVVDVSAPAQPRVLAQLDTPGFAQDVFVRGNIAYVADGEGGLQMVDLSQPDQPRLLGSWSASGVAYGVGVSGKRAYVAMGEAGVHVLDVSDPAHPSEVACYDTPSGPADVELVDNRTGAVDVAVLFNLVYVADLRGGLVIVRDTGAPPPQKTFLPLVLRGR